MKLVPSLCPYCGVGCGLYLIVEEEKLTNIEYMLEHPVNLGALCPKGNAALQVVFHKDRLRYPLKKEGGNWKRINWNEACKLAANKLLQTKEAHSSDSLGFLASAKCTNEENYLLQKLARILGTNNIDHCARLCHAPTVAGLVKTFGSGAMTNSIPDIKQADCIFIVGSNFAENHPVVSKWVLEAKDRGAKIILADPRYTPTAWIADIYLRLRPGTDIALINGMMNTIIKEKLEDRDFIQKRTEGFKELKKAVKNYGLERVEKITGVSKDLILKAAKIYGKAKRSAIIYCMGITQHTTGTDNVISLANLALITGNIGEPGTGVNPLRGQNNVQGACDVGALATLFPGYIPIKDEIGRKRIAKYWGLDGLPGKAGLTVVEMTEAVYQGKIKAMYIMGENPMVTDPNINHVREGLEKLDFLIVQDIFLTETAELAHLILPACSWTEREGSITATDRRVQWQTKAIPPLSEAKPDWEIICSVAKEMGLERYFDFKNPEDILKEINQVVPFYRGIVPERVKASMGGIPWPCPDKEHAGTPILHKDKFKTANGLGRIIPVEHREPQEMPSKDFPFILTTGRVVMHLNSGAMTRRSPSLFKRTPELFVEINPDDAEKLGIKKNDLVKVSTRRGEVKARAIITKKVAQGVIFMPFHFHQTNVLTIDVLDPQAKIPEYKVCACRIEI
ncbi:MAG: formate dehydrogenase subunit alpha [bacterium]